MFALLREMLFFYESWFCLRASIALVLLMKDYLFGFSWKWRSAVLRLGLGADLCPLHVSCSRWTFGDPLRVMWAWRTEVQAGWPPPPCSWLPI